MPECLLSVRVTPRSSRNTIVGWRDDVLCIKITAPPVEGAANTHLIKYLAESIGVRRQDITLVSGQKGRQKTLRVTGLTIGDIRDRLKIA